MKMILAVALLVLFQTLPSFGQGAVSEVGHTPKLRGEKKIKASFVKLKPMLGMVGEDSEFTLYAGIPRHSGDLGLESKLDAKTIVKRYGGVFYVTPKKVEAEDAKKLKALVQDPKSFMKFRGFKLCGGFHPDFSLVWGTGDNVVEVHVCFGCYELKAFHKGVEVYCDIPDGSYKELKKLLQKYQK